MNPLKQINEALDYVEANLDGEIDFERLARIAGSSIYGFRRMFSYLAGMSLGEYIRCRRLSLAGELLSGGMKVIDCAVLLGYESPDAFRKAFEAMHGVVPSKAKAGGAALKAFPPMRFQLTIKGGSNMEYRVIHKGGFNIIGFKKLITLQYEGINPQMDSLTAKLTPEVVAALKAMNDTEPKGILNVSVMLEQRPVEGEELMQYVGVATGERDAPGFDTLAVAESDWAVFTVVGEFPKAVQQTWARIYAEWLPASEYQSTGGPEILWYESPDLTKPDCKNEIWVPVERRG